MAGKPKPNPMEAVELNMGDAEGLVLLAESLTNHRARRGSPVAATWRHRQDLHTEAT